MVYFLDLLRLETYQPAPYFDQRSKGLIHLPGVPREPRLQLSWSRVGKGFWSTAVRMLNSSPERRGALSSFLSSVLSLSGRLVVICVRGCGDSRQRLVRGLRRSVDSYPASASWPLATTQSFFTTSPGFFPKSR
jgi:hypothetical protein